MKKSSQNLQSDRGNELQRKNGVSKPVSLAPLLFDEALDSLLEVKPATKDESKKAAKKTTRKKKQ